MDFSNFLIPYVFDVKEPVYRGFTRPLFSGDLEIPGQLPVLQELEGTDGWVLWIFVISLFPTFSRSRNLFLVVSQSYHVQVTSKIQVNVRFRRTGTPGYCRLGLMDFSNFFIPYVFDVKESVFRSFTRPLGSSDLGTPGQLPVSEVL